MPPPTVPPDGSPLYAGADIGGTKIGMVLIGEDGRSIDEHRHPTDVAEGADAIIARITECLHGCYAAQRSRIAGLGVGVAGQVDPNSGAVSFAPNLQWHDVPLGARLRAALGIPVAVTNDVRAATWGEWLAGAGVGVNDLVVLFIGTGIGGGVVSDGRVLHGASNTFGELGHVTVVAGGRTCRCGNAGCVEAYAGGWAIGERAREMVRDDPASGAALVRMAGSVEEIDAAIVSAAYRVGDPLAIGLLDDAARHLAAAAVGFVNALNPARLILGGGVVAGMPELVDVVTAAIRAHALPAASAVLDVRRAALGSEVAALGAAILARATLAAH